MGEVTPNLPALHFIISLVPEATLHHAPCSPSHFLLVLFFNTLPFSEPSNMRVTVILHQTVPRKRVYDFTFFYTDIHLATHKAKTDFDTHTGFFSVAFPFLSKLETYCMLIHSAFLIIFFPHEDYILFICSVGMLYLQAEQHHQ